MRIFFYFLLLAVPLNNNLLKAQEVYTVKDEKKPVRISDRFYYYEDKNNALTVSEALESTAFRQLNKEIPNYNVTTSTIWAKIRLTCAEKAGWYLSLEPSAYNQVSIFQKRGKGELKETRAGNILKTSDRQFATNHFFFPLDLEPGDTTMVLFRLQDYYPVQLDFKIGKIESFIAPFHNMDLYNGLCYGIMIMMLIYNFYLFLTQRMKAYIYYVLYIFFSLLFSSYLSGYSLHFPDFLLKINLLIPILFPACFGIFGLLFTIELFKEALPRSIKKVIYIFITLALFDVVLSTTGYIHLAENIIQGLGLLLGLLSFTCAIAAYRKCHSSARFYLMGFGAYMLSLFYIILSAQDIFPISNFLWQALVTGSAIESIMLSFALGDKLKMSLLEQEKAKEEAFFQAKENERLVKEQNTVLEKRVEERTHELAEKNKEVMDSIHYARRIQSALLANDEFFKTHLSENFTLFRPKDIVSGDFYWATEKESRIYLAVCDSTGHGVPGAFMSLLNTSFLNEAVMEKNIVSPDEVFNYVRRKLIENISQEGGKDGMDGILICIDKNNGTITYAAANNKPVLVSDQELSILAADKMPVGKGERTDAFTLYSLVYRTGDLLYLYTDGYADQFGGPKGKKFKYKNLDALLLANSGKDLADQKQILEDTFLSWKGNLEQVDDVLLICIRL
ncbi:MAG: 7TM diverse intracellular signaling domain-containing protein [Bacteroidia bacterium]